MALPGRLARRPGGPRGPRRRSPCPRAPASGAGREMTRSIDRPGGTPPLLEVRAVTKRFGGLVANRAISFDVTPGEIVGVIGPNGAGKSTLFDVVTGFHRPESGEVRLAGEALGGLRPDQINRRGIARTFQKLRPFSGMTVRDNASSWALSRARRPSAARGPRRTAAWPWWGSPRRPRPLRPRAVHRAAEAARDGARPRDAARSSSCWTRSPAVWISALDPGARRADRPAPGGGVTLLVIEHNMQVIDERRRRASSPSTSARRSRTARPRTSRATAGSSRRTSARPTSSHAAGQRLSVAYGDFQVLWDVSLEVGAGEIVALLGPNGAGQVHPLNSVSGLVPAQARPHRVDGRRVDGLPAHARVRLRPRARAGAPPAVPPSHRAAEPPARRPYHPAAKPHRAESLAAVERALPRLREPPRAAGAHAVRGRAADGGHRARPHEPASPPPGRQSRSLGLAPRVVADILDGCSAASTGSKGSRWSSSSRTSKLALSIAHRGYVPRVGPPPAGRRRRHAAHIRRGAPDLPRALSTRPAGSAIAPPGGAVLP